MCSDGEVSKDNAKKGHSHWKEFVNQSYLKMHKTAPYVETIGISTAHDADVLDGFIANDQVGNYCKVVNGQQISNAFERAQNETMSRSTATKLSIEFPLNVYNDIYNSDDKDTKFHLHDLIITTEDFSSNFWVSIGDFDNTTTGGDNLQLIVNEQPVSIVINEVTNDAQCQLEAIEFYNQVLKDMLHTLKNITNPEKLKIKAKEIENELDNKYVEIFKTITAEPTEKTKLQNEIKQLLSVKNNGTSKSNDDNKSTDDGDDISKRRAVLMKRYKQLNKEWRKRYGIIRVFQNTLASLKTLVREIILGQVRIQEIRQHILDLHFRKKHAKRMEKLILTDEQLRIRQEMYDKIVIPTEEDCKDITDEIGTGCYLSTLSFREVAEEGDSLWMCGRISRSGGVAVSNPELIKIAYISGDLVSDSYFRMALEAAGNDNDDEKGMDKVGFADSSRELINARLFPIYGNEKHMKATAVYMWEVMSHTLTGRTDIKVVDYNALWTCLGYMILRNDLTTKNVHRILFEMKPSLKLLSEHVKLKPFKPNSYSREPDTTSTDLITLAEKKRTRIVKYMQTFRARTTAWVSEVATLFADRLMNQDQKFDQEFYLSALLHRLRIMFNLQAPKNMDDTERCKIEDNHKKLLQILICGDGNDDESEDEKTTNDGDEKLKFLKGVYVKNLLKMKKLFDVPKELKLTTDFDKKDEEIVAEWNVNEIKPSTKKVVIAILSRIDNRDLIKGYSFFKALSEVECDEKDEDKFCAEFMQKCKYKDINKVSNNLNILFDQIGWKTNFNVLRAICCIGILFHRNKAYHDNCEWFGDNEKKQILKDPESVLKNVYLKYVLRNMRYDYRTYLERKNMEKLREIHTNPILPDNVDEYGNLPYLTCAWSRCGKTFDNRDQLLNHVRYALYGESRPLLHGFHSHCSQILCREPNMTLEQFKRKVRSSFSGSKYHQYIKLPVYDKKLKSFYQTFYKGAKKPGGNNPYQNQQSRIISYGNMYYFDQLCTIRKH